MLKNIKKFFSITALTFFLISSPVSVFASEVDDVTTQDEIESTQNVSHEEDTNYLINFSGNAFFTNEQLEELNTYLISANKSEYFGIVLTKSGQTENTDELEQILADNPQLEGEVLFIDFYTRHYTFYDKIFNAQVYGIEDFNDILAANDFYKALNAIIFYRTQVPPRVDELLENGIVDYTNTLPEADIKLILSARTASFERGETPFFIIFTDNDTSFLAKTTSILKHYDGEYILYSINLTSRSFDSCKTGFQLDKLNERFNEYAIDDFKEDRFGPGIVNLINHYYDDETSENVDISTATVSLFDTDNSDAESSESISSEEQMEYLIILAIRIILFILPIAVFIKIASFMLSVLSDATSTNVSSEDEYNNSNGFEDFKNDFQDEVDRLENETKEDFDFDTPSKKVEYLKERNEKIQHKLDEDGYEVNDDASSYQIDKTEQKLAEILKEAAKEKKNLDHDPIFDLTPEEAQGKVSDKVLKSLEITNSLELADNKIEPIEPISVNFGTNDTLSPVEEELFEKIKDAVDNLKPVKANLETFTTLLDEYNKLSLSKQMKLPRKYSTLLSNYKNMSSHSAI